MKQVKVLALLVLLLSIVMAGCDNPAGSNGNGDPPSTPAAPTVSPGDTELAISWAALAGASAYEVWYHMADDSAAATQSGADLSGTSHTIMGLTNGITYYVWVRVKNDAGISGFSPAASGTPFQPFYSYTSGTAGQVGYTEAFSRYLLLFEMKYCPGGTFPTGSDDLGGDQTESAFWIGETEVTYELWDTVHTWATANGYLFANPGTRGGGAGTFTDQHPVTTINWQDAMVWCNALSEMARLSPVYKNSGNVVRDSRDYNIPQCDWVTADDAADGFRLPGSMEWECAARYRGSDPTNAVLKSGIYWTKGDSASGATADYNNATATGNVAWYSSNSGSTTHEVKKKAGSHTLGVHDMSGNVWEWCFDWSTPEHSRVIRGGSWGDTADLLRVGDMGHGAYRISEDGTIGFRLSRTAE